MTLPRTLPNHRDEPTLSLDRAAAILGVDRRTLGEAVSRGEYPGIRVGRRVVIPTEKFLKAVGLTA